MVTYTLQVATHKKSFIVKISSSEAFGKVTAEDADLDRAISQALALASIQDVFPIDVSGVLHSGGGTLVKRATKDGRDITLVVESYDHFQDFLLSSWSDLFKAVRTIRAKKGSTDMIDDVLPPDHPWHERTEEEKADIACAISLLLRERDPQRR